MLDFRLNLAAFELLDLTETLKIRREKQVRAMLRMLTSAVDIHVERS